MPGFAPMTGAVPGKPAPKAPAKAAAPKKAKKKAAPAKLKGPVLPPAGGMGVAPMMPR